MKRKKKKGWGRQGKKDKYRLYSLGESQITAEIKMTGEGVGTKNST